METDIHIHFIYPSIERFKSEKSDQFLICSDLLVGTYQQLQLILEKNSFLRSKETDILHPIPKKSRDFSLFFSFGNISNTLIQFGY